MTLPRMPRIWTAVLPLVVIALSSNSLADDTDELSTMLREFLIGVTEAETHDRFWAEDLIYTSSRGTRSRKPDIMQGFADVDNTDVETQGPAFSAQDIQIQVYDDAAVVAFRLVATLPDGAGNQEYLNTGTFLKRDDIWQVVAWQATIIPGTIVPAQ